MPEYAWEAASLFSHQGSWSEEEFLSATDSINTRVEFIDGKLEFIEMPTEAHEELFELIYEALKSYVNARQLGKVRFSGIRVRTKPGKLRRPDVLFLNKKNFHLCHNRAWDGIDLAVKIVSDDPKDRKRDYEVKFAEYAAPGIAEYWIVDYQERVVIVNRLSGEKYIEHCRCKAASQAVSALLDGFTVDVAELFAAADELA